MGYYAKLQKLCQIEARSNILIVGIVAITCLILQYIMLPYGSSALKSLLQDNGAHSSVKISLNQSLEKSENENEINPSILVGAVEKDDDHKDYNFRQSNNLLMDNVDRIIENNITSEGKGQDESLGLDKMLGPKLLDDVSVSSSRVELNNTRRIEQMVEPEHQILRDNSLELNDGFSIDEGENVESWNQANLVQFEEVRELPNTEFTLLKNDSKKMRTRRRKKVRPGPPTIVIPIDRINKMVSQHFSSSIKLKTHLSSLKDRDKEIYDAKLKILNSAAPNVVKELYAPVFRNVSVFIRSYELMEKTLRVYVYKDGKKPIFHQPLLKGLYASEGWFMKLMEGNKHYVVKNPKKAHLFYMPLSSKLLEYTLYVPNSHNRTKLMQCVKDYSLQIAAKYPFWNRTGGADHFVVACHDWAPYETRQYMKNSIKALCNADITIGFKIGRDVSLPETLVRIVKYPTRDVGGKQPSYRNILAFYAGNSHGYLRPILLKHWKDKDPDMRIYGVLPTSISKRTSYIQHMKSSKYCLCPKGHEVNSPRVVEAILYECVPVIISDNFVPPFFEILNWEAFSIIIAEKDIPKLKTILTSIPDEKYMKLQYAVRRVQKHFLWHARPKKYDIFHMILHSIWYSRVFQIPSQ
ncbi:unnamed protein product [Amaranthus hypochondriacus]